MIHGISAKYITQGGQKGFVDSILEQNNHSSLVGLRQKSALEDVAKHGSLNVQMGRAKQDQIQKRRVHVK